MEIDVTRDNIFIKDVLFEFLPAQCDVIGEPHLDVMINHQVDLEQSQFGAMLDYISAYQAIASMIDFINNCISIYRYVNESESGDSKKKKEKGRKLISKEVTTITTLIKSDQVKIVEKIEIYFFDR